MCLATYLRDVLMDSVEKKAVLNAKMATLRMNKFAQSVRNSLMGVANVPTSIPALNAQVSFLRFKQMGPASVLVNHHTCSKTGMVPATAMVITI